MKTSIVIVTYGQWELTERCLLSLQSALGDRLGHDWEIVVVDNNSPDETPQRLQEWSDRIRLDLRPDNLNFAGGCNRGAELARGGTLLFLNNDTQVFPGALEMLVEQLDEPGIAAAGPRLLFPDGTIQHAGVAFVRNPKLGGAPMPQHVFHHHAGELPATRAVFEAECVTAACLAVRKDAFVEVGGYDTGFVNGLEDVDLCLKLRVAGHRIVYRGDIDILHYEGATRGQGQELSATPDKVATMASNDKLFIGRWSWQLEADDELALRIWDARLDDTTPERSLIRASTLVVVGQPRGVGAGADEARALLVALEAIGHTPSARDLPSSNVHARLSGDIKEATARAMRTPAAPDIPYLCVPMAPHDVLYHPQGRPTPGPDAFVRLGTARTSLDLSAGPTVLAGARSVANELVADGMPDSRVRVMYTPLGQRPLGSGGAGLLVVLPTHDRALTASILNGLVKLSQAYPIRLLPTAFDHRLGDIVRGHLRGTELLGPCTDEERFAQLASESDVVLAADLTDWFERRSLIAASVGTPTVSFNPTGPVSEIIGHRATTTPETFQQAVQAAIEPTSSRDQLRRLVLTACGAEPLRSLLPDPRQIVG